MESVAILLTVFNRKEKTLRCLDSIQMAYCSELIPFHINVYITDDGSSDDTEKEILDRRYGFSISILKGDGNLFWNRGMINSWNAALASGIDYDGFLWLNNDTIILPNHWSMLQDADHYAKQKWGCGQIYVGSTKDKNTDAFTYGGFVFVNLWTLKDRFLPPNGHYQECQCSHGNITYVSKDVVNRMGIFTNEYGHGGSDHDYTYRAFKKGFHLIVLPEYSAICENDHPSDGGRSVFEQKNTRDRLVEVHSERGNIRNSLLFQKRCFPWRYPFVLLTGWMKAVFPNLYHKIYLFARGCHA